MTGRRQVAQTMSRVWSTERRQSKKLKDLGDIARLVESHPYLWEMLDPDLKEIIRKQ
jgi:hypothetical protein